jgi:hypothetical protein
MSGQLELTQVKPRHWICPVPKPGSSNHLRICPAPARTCSDLWHPNGKIPFGCYKRTPMPPQLGRSLHSIANTLNQCFLWSKPLSFKLPKRDLSRPFEWPSKSLSKCFTDDLHVFVTLGDLSPWWTRCCLGVTKVVMNLRKFVLPSPLCGFDSGKPN